MGVFPYLEIMTSFRYSHHVCDGVLCFVALLIMLVCIRISAVENGAGLFSVAIVILTLGLH